jgi:hypothetical protein
LAAIRRLELEGRMHVGEDAIPITAIGGFVPEANRLNVGLRHCPRSIPQAQESA